jgi:uncharacterized protein YjbJ (UPF0337 family)
MDWKEVKRGWKLYRDKVQDRWSELTTEELDEIGGSYERLVSALQEKYGITQEQAELELREFHSAASA